MGSRRGTRTPRARPGRGRRDGAPDAGLLERVLVAVRQVDGGHAGAWQRPQARAGWRSARGPGVLGPRCRQPSRTGARACAGSRRRPAEDNRGAVCDPSSGASSATRIPSWPGPQRSCVKARCPPGVARDRRVVHRVGGERFDGGRVQGSPARDRDPREERSVRRAQGETARSARPRWIRTIRPVYTLRVARRPSVGHAARSKGVSLTDGVGSGVGAGVAVAGGSVTSGSDTHAASSSAVDRSAIGRARRAVTRRSPGAPVPPARCHGSGTHTGGRRVRARGRARGLCSAQIAAPPSSSRSWQRGLNRHPDRRC